MCAILEALKIDRENVVDAEYDQATRTLDVETTGGESGRQIEALIAGMMRTQRLLPRKVLLENRVQSLTVHDIDAGLAASSDLHLLGDGLVAIRGSLGFVSLF